MCLVVQMAGYAQDSTFSRVAQRKLPVYCIEANGFLGASSAKVSGPSLAGYGSDYIQGVSVLKDASPRAGSGTGFNADVARFWGRKKQWGISVGAAYTHYSGQFGLDSFHVEYHGTDAWGNDFRQIITANNGTAKGDNPGNVAENVKFGSLSVPVMLKYRYQIGRSIVLTGGVGAVLDVYGSAAYGTNGVFDYGAIYAMNSTTKAYYYNTTASSVGYASGYAYAITPANVRDETYYYAIKSGEGLNVGSQVHPTTSTGNVTYRLPGLGAVGQMDAAYFISSNLLLSLGLYYSDNMPVNGQNNRSAGWRLTSDVGSYTSMFAGYKSVAYETYGVTIGVKYLLENNRDMDGDGIPDRFDDCVFAAGRAGDDRGCPDFDGDGIPDIYDACPFDKGPACTMGCPDRDNDCIADKNDACPDEWGVRKFNGCNALLPLKNGAARSDEDSILGRLINFTDSAFNNVDFGSESDDNRVRTLLKTDTVFVYGNPELKKVGKLKTDKIYFEKGKKMLRKSTLEKLDELVQILKQHPALGILVTGYTDDVGSENYNILLSFRRAETIANYLRAKGVEDRRIILTGKGKQDPEVTGRSGEARSKNRRIVLKMIQLAE
jgi:outer membrane protein OmpA-like peptidoglycan-associated protein